MSQAISSSTEQQAMSDASTFRSVLFRHEIAEEEIEGAPTPEHFHDLHLDEIARVVCSLQRGALESYFRVPLPDVESVRYRQDAIQECERPGVQGAVARFADEFTLIGLGLNAAGQLRFQRQRERRLLDAVGDYCRAMRQFDVDLREIRLSSAAWNGARDHLRRLVASPSFQGLCADHDRVRGELDQISYSLLIHENRIKVDRFAGEPDLSAHVVDLFDRFRGEPPEEASTREDLRYGFSHIDAQILDHVAEIFPGPFRALREFWDQHRDFLDPVVARLGREANLVLAWVEAKRQLAERGLPLCFPELDTSASLSATDSYDLALATRNRGEAVVTNSVRLSDGERLVVVTGPNQGGKTTFARMIGQTHYLAALGFPVPGSAARLPLTNNVFAHFEREEEPGTERGKLKDDLIRMRHILDRVTPDSVVVLNEVFSSTTTADALGLARRVLDQLVETGCLTVCVTFLDELAEPSTATVSMVAEVDPADPSHRTFVIQRRPADGKAYAAAIANKYRLTREAITRRVGR